ncbi:hypothetical protein LQ327_04595 [Actinomycetospora endophytica]|uniref:DUF3093 family protein n=1 Tax=Actinomycetospora endophytica TaxID=2291215 RepID=A0ABS8P358_9PSEU|nr:hypothetical protein [Actinomycetospora endophytica]MCD2192668.1 hypothetical protein [Actinomycetospora endophytica]
MTGATAPVPDDEVLFAEAGAPWWPLLIGPVVGGGGLLLDRLAPGGATPWAWIAIGVLLLLPIALIVRTRRRLLGVRLTPATLTQGDEAVGTASIVGARPADGSGRYGIRPLGGHPSVPRHLGVVVVTLDDGSRRAAWARDADGLHAALSRVLAERTAAPVEGA